jgi:hypothetical protein
MTRLPVMSEGDLALMHYLSNLLLLIYSFLLFLPTLTEQTGSNKTIVTNL